jgi:hypothetical protein
MGAIQIVARQERLPSASPSGFLTAFGMASYLTKKKGEEGISGKAADSFLFIYFANDRHFEWSEAE